MARPDRPAPGGTRHRACLLALLAALALLTLGARPAAALTPTSADLARHAVLAGEDAPPKDRWRDALDSSDDAVYESPHYGYTLTFDPEEWEVLIQDEEPDDAYDAVVFTNRVSVVGVVGVPHYGEDEADRCVADYGTGLELDDRLTDIEPLDGPGAAGADGDRAWATYAATFASPNGTETEMVWYAECTWLGDGVTVGVLHGAPAGAYADERAARADLLAGLAPVSEDERP